MAEIIASLLILFGAFFVLVGSIGLARFPDFYTRLHGPTKATTLGLAALLGAFVAWTVSTGGGPSAREFLITFFLFITAPVSAHILGRAALRRRLRSITPPPEPLAIEDRNE